VKPLEPGPVAAGTEATLRRLAALGPFFAVAAHPPPVRPDAAPPAPWRVFGELTADPALLRDRVDRVRAHLASAGRQPVAAVELRVAASVAQLGLTARLLSPALALAALDGARPCLDPGALRWQPELGGAFPLSLPLADLAPGPDPAPAPGVPAGTADPAGTVEAWADALLAGPVRELVRAVARLSVAEQILWGNVASAVDAAARVAGAALPARAARLRATADLLLDHPLLRAAHTADAGTGRFRRRNCCLIYRAAPGRAGGLCGDCVLGGGRAPAR